MEITVHNLTKTFGSLRANDGISLSFAAGQIHGVLGENGAGKSTLMKVLSGFLRRDGGETRLNGTPTALGSPDAALQSGIGMVHQDPLDVPAFTALENFYCASPRRALPNLAAARRALLNSAKHLGFPVAPDTPIASLTVGQRQQLEIMRLLACGAQVLILDEPTTGITAAQAAALFAALRQLASEGKTVLFVSHKLDEVAALCHTVSVLRAGRVMGAGQMAMPQPQERLLELMFGQNMGDTRSEISDLQQPISNLQSPNSNLQPPTPVWRLDNVTLREGILTLANLNLRLVAGRVVGLAGLEGSGQQLLLRLLSGRLRPAAGRLWLNGNDVTGAHAEVFRRAGVQFLPADRMAEGLVGSLSLTDHLVLQNGRGLLLDRQAATTQARAAIADYNIKATPDTPLLALSGGNQQRAMLALLPERCTGLLLEQPTRGLDVASARSIWERLLARRASGTALVFATADLDEILEYSDEVLVFFGGRVSPPLPRDSLSQTRLAELIGGVGFGE
ncbi:MAG: ATP-binding cassette domain-containing protein [Chloroflexaceae bacterium]|nr:ATP-binding cassette domain-containing protein [Chloroflexaceae bacterium]